MPKSYTKKAITIQAIQWVGNNFDELKEFCSIIGVDDIDDETQQIQPLIKTLEGEMLISINDYLIKGIKGEFYPCKPDIFEASYDCNEISKEDATEQDWKEYTSFITLIDKDGELYCNGDSDKKGLDIALNIIKQAEVGNFPIGVNFKLQSDPIKEVGVNGVQITALIEVGLEMIKKLNTRFPCRENAITITKLEEALMWQEARTKNREKRGVEGKNEK